MSAMDKYKAFLERPRDSVDYWAEGAILDFTDRLAEIMDGQDVSRAELARRVGTSQAYITKVFGGQANFTVETMTKLALALDYRIRIHISPRNAQTRMIDFYQNHDHRAQETSGHEAAFTMLNGDRFGEGSGYRWVEEAGYNA